MVALPVAAVALGGLPTSAAETSARADGYRILFESSCGNTGGADLGVYSMRPDGSRLTALFRRGRALEPLAVSQDGGTIAYGRVPWIYVSRADGTGLGRVVPGFAGRDYPFAISRDGRLLAFSKGDGIWIVGADGHGLRRVSSAPGEGPDWSPDGEALVLASRGVVVQPLHGPRRVLAPRGFAPIKWSPDGRWIAFERDDGLWVAQPDGEHRHRVARSNGPFTWSPDGHTLDVVTLQGVAVVDVDGRPLRRLFGGLRLGIFALTWSPDGRRLAMSDGRDDIWVVGSDGRGLRRLTTGCSNHLLGWTRLAPVLPRVPPAEHLLAVGTVETQVPIGSLSADGPRVAYGAFGAATCGGRVVVWTPSSRSLRRFPCGDVGYGFALAGSRVAWVDGNKCGDKAGINCDSTLYSATLAHPVAQKLTSDEGLFSLRGHGHLLVFSAGPEYDDPDRPERLVRIGGGHERCGPDRGSSRVCTTLRRGALGCCPQSVSDGLIAMGGAVLGAKGRLVRLFPFASEGVSAARLDGDRLVVARSGMLEAYDIVFGARVLSRPLPQGHQLEDVDGGIAVLSVPRGIMLIRLADGRSFTFAPGKAPRLGDLEPPGLYYSYATADGEGRVVFMPRAELVRQLGGGS